jgi:hypothetical protein
MRKLALAITSVSIVVLAGCGGAGENEGNVQSKTNTATAGWNAADACSLLDKAAVGAALGDTVTEASLGLVNQASGPNAATSECTYLLESGGRASLMTRNSPIADNTPEAIALARNATQKTVAAFTDKKIEDIPDLGIAAFFVPGINQLNVYIDDKRFVILTISSAPNAGAKAMAVDLFKKIKS